MTPPRATRAPFLLLAALLLAALCQPAPAPAQDAPPIPQPVGLVNDRANLLDARHRGG
jgi:hypothetical protein